MTTDRLGKFLEGTASAVLLLNKAIENRSALEALVLVGALNDGKLRIGMILKRQLTLKTKDIDETLLHQMDSDKKVSERAIIKMALESEMISMELYRRMNTLYDKRNKCIHRYLISDINYNYVTSVFFEYMEVSEVLHQLVFDLEAEQIRQGVGMTIKGPAVEVPVILEMARKKMCRPDSDA